MEKKGRKIVVAVDEGEESMYALNWCFTNLVSQTKNCNLVLLYVKPPPQIYIPVIIHSELMSKGYMFSGDVVGAVEKYRKQLVDSVMERADTICSNFNATNISMERVVGSGDAKDVICRAVQKLKADTLVMGTHGYGFFKRGILGSVSDHCAKHAKCHVVIVKHP